MLGGEAADGLAGADDARDDVRMEGGAKGGGVEYPCDSASGDASRPVGVDLPVNHALPSDDLALKYYYFKFVLLTRQDTKAPRNAEQ